MIFTFLIIIFIFKHYFYRKIAKMQKQLVKARYESLHKKIANKIFVNKVITATLCFPEKYKMQQLLRDLFFLKLEGCLKGYFLLLGDNIPSESTMVERTGLSLKSIIKTEDKGREFTIKTLSTTRQVGNVWNEGEAEEVEVEVARNQKIQNNNFKKKNIKKNEKGNEDREIEKKKVKDRGEEIEQQTVKEKEKRKRQKIEEINQKEEKYWNMTSTRFNSLRR